MSLQQAFSHQSLYQECKHEKGHILRQNLNVTNIQHEERMKTDYKKGLKGKIEEAGHYQT
jgi:hypothetical protein